MGPAPKSCRFVTTHGTHQDDDVDVDDSQGIQYCSVYEKKKSRSFFGIFSLFLVLPTQYNMKASHLTLVAKFKCCRAVLVGIVSIALG